MEGRIKLSQLKGIGGLFTMTEPECRGDIDCQRATKEDKEGPNISFELD